MDDKYIEEVGSRPVSKNTTRIRSLKNLEKKEEPKMPSGFQMVKNLTKSIAKTGKAALRGDKVIADTDLSASRTAICKGCPWFVPKGERCQKCGCVIPLKVYFSEEKCPIGKW